MGCKRPELGAEFEVFFTRWMGTPNFAELFAKQIQSDAKMQVLTGYTAAGFRGDGGRLTAVRVADGKGQSHWIEADMVILAAGTIETARLLLHAAQDPEWRAPWAGQSECRAVLFRTTWAGRSHSFEPVNQAGILPDVFECRVRGAQVPAEDSYA